MLVETLVTVLIAGFATIAVFGHVLLLQAAFTGPKTRNPQVPQSPRTAILKSRNP